MITLQTERRIWRDWVWRWALDWNDSGSCPFGNFRIKSFKIFIPNSWVLILFVMGGFRNLVIIL